ncbi:MAG: asparaginase [Roseovarius sp.]
MTHPVSLVEIWRGSIVESQHLGHAVICDDTGQIVDAWGDPEAVVYPRSSSKMIQALPLVESGAAAAFGLTSEQLALSCASHSAAAIHTDRVTAWLAALGKTDADFRCGPQEPEDIPARNALITSDESPCRYHNNCSGKHCGFLTLSDHLKAGPDYVEMDHPVQRACLAAFEEVTGRDSEGYGIDGCSAPNHLTSLHAMARAMAFYAAAREGTGIRESAAAQLRDAMIAHPQLVAGEPRACTRLMRACSEPVALKTGAEGYYIAILPQRKQGIALKIADGATRASQCVIAALLVRLGALDPAHPTARAYLDMPLYNFAGLHTGRISAAATLR